jgi:hypothetical protein
MILFGSVILQGLENPVGILVEPWFLAHTYKVKKKDLAGGLCGYPAGFNLTAGRGKF